MFQMMLKILVIMMISAEVNCDIEYPEVEYCPVVNNCRTALLYEVKYRCIVDKVCPKGYKCCKTGCYVHKVCVLPVNKNGEKITLPLEGTTENTDLFTKVNETIVINESTEVSTDNNLITSEFELLNTVSQKHEDIPTVSPILEENSSTIYNNISTNLSTTEDTTSRTATESPSHGEDKNSSATSIPNQNLTETNTSSTQLPNTPIWSIMTIGSSVYENTEVPPENLIATTEKRNDTKETQIFSEDFYTTESSMILTTAVTKESITSSNKEISTKSIITPTKEKSDFEELKNSTENVSEDISTARPSIVITTIDKEGTTSGDKEMSIESIITEIIKEIGDFEESKNSTEDIPENFSTAEPSNTITVFISKETIIPENTKMSTKNINTSTKKASDFEESKISTENVFESFNTTEEIITEDTTTQSPTLSTTISSKESASSDSKVRESEKSTKTNTKLTEPYFTIWSIMTTIINEENTGSESKNISTDKEYTYTTEISGASTQPSDLSTWSDSIIIVSENSTVYENKEFFSTTDEIKKDVTSYETNVTDENNAAKQTTLYVNIDQENTTTTTKEDVPIEFTTNIKEEDFEGSGNSFTDDDEDQTFNTTSDWKDFTDDETSYIEGSGNDEDDDESIIFPTDERLATQKSVTNDDDFDFGTNTAKDFSETVPEGTDTTESEVNNEKATSYSSEDVSISTVKDSDDVSSSLTSEGNFNTTTKFENNISSSVTSTEIVTEKSLERDYADAEDEGDDEEMTTDEPGSGLKESTTSEEDDNNNINTSIKLITTTDDFLVMNVTEDEDEDDDDDDEDSVDEEIRNNFQGKTKVRE